MQLIGLYHHSSEHKELGASRRRRDFEDTTKIYEHLKPRNPFLVEKADLISLSTGIASRTGSDNINCDQAEEIGLSIQRSFDNTSFSQCTIRRKDVIKPLASLITSKQCGESSGRCDEQAMFIRLVAIGSRMDQEAMEATFEHELTSEPMALFKTV